MQKPTVKSFFDKATCTVSYIVSDKSTGKCAIIDPVLDFDPCSGRTSTASADALIAHVRANHLTVAWILETHVHADHLTAAAYLADTFGAPVAIGSAVTASQRGFKELFNIDDSLAVDGSQFDRLLADGDTFAIGGLEGRVLHTPGHTPACVSYLIGDSLFVGDTIFMPDFGSARCDFPGGDARTLYRSIRTMLSCPPETRMFVGHDYAPGGA